MNLEEMRALTLAIVLNEQDSPYLLQGPIPEIRAPKKTPAYTDLACSPTMRRVLQQRGEWVGPRAAIVFNHPVNHPVTLHIWAHELGHATEPFAREDREPTTQEIEHDAQSLAIWKDSPPDNCTLLPWWPHHGWEFIRRALHVHQRASKLGCRLKLENLCIAGDFYGLSGVHSYSRMLGDEPEKLSHMTFSQIEEIEPPPYFRRLFEGDKKRWHKLQKDMNRAANVAAFPSQSTPEGI